MVYSIVVYLYFENKDRNQDRVRIGEVHYEANTSTIGWKEVDVYWRNNWLVSSYGGSIYFVMYFANSDMPQILKWWTFIEQ